jgi:hypothetical protein
MAPNIHHRIITLAKNKYVFIQHNFLSFIIDIKQYTVVKERNKIKCQIPMKSQD